MSIVNATVSVTEDELTLMNSLINLLLFSHRREWENIDSKCSTNRPEDKIHAKKFPRAFPPYVLWIWIFYYQYDELNFIHIQGSQQLLKVGLPKASSLHKFDQSSHSFTIHRYICLQNPKDDITSFGKSVVNISLTFSGEKSKIDVHIEGGGGAQACEQNEDRKGLDRMRRPRN